jgi:phosphate transport system substrate-binding protein
MGRGYTIKFKEERMQRMTLWLTLTTILLGSLAGFAGTLIKVDGSSTVFPITEAVAEEFQKAERGKVNVTVGISGTGGGFKKFCGGETDISDASRPIKPSEVSLCGKNAVDYIELPVAYDGIAVVVNKANTWVDYLTVSELNKIWAPESTGKVTKWSQVRASFPDKPLVLFGPGTDSGTFDYFTEAINGKSMACRTDFTPSEDDNVLVQGVASEVGGLGYFGVAYYEENQDKLKVVPIMPVGGSKAHEPTYDNIKNAVYQPLSRPLFIYVNKASIKKPEVKRFIEFYLKNGGELSKEVGYIALPDQAYDLAAKRFAKGVTGSVFGGQGAQVGVKVEDLLAKEK